MSRLSVMLLLGGAVSAALSTQSVAQPRRELMRDVHELVYDHDSVTRQVEELDNGVRTTTTTTNPALLPVLRKHPRQMGALYRQGGMVRGWDPLFRELAMVADRVTMKVTNVTDGVEVQVTSDDAEVVKLIKAHAAKVSTMVERGMAAMHEATPLPEGYTRPDAETSVTSKSAGALWDGQIVQHGKMHEAIGQKQHQGRVELKLLIEQPHFYGVGALARLEGETTIVDGAISVTRVGAEGKLVAVEAGGADASATLLAGGYVPAWTEHFVEETVAADEADAYIAAAAAAAGLDATRPFVFVASGTFRDVRLHVINGACPLHARLRKLELPPEERPFELEVDEIPGTVVGIYAKDAVGDLTHPATATHLHLVYTEAASGAQVTGHVEQIGWPPGTVLRFPQVK